jgi:hypothetical protein
MNTTEKEILSIFPNLVDFLLEMDRLSSWTERKWGHSQGAGKLIKESMVKCSVTHHARLEFLAEQARKIRSDNA